MTNAETIIQSLQDEPEAWTGTKFSLSHRSGVKLWIANGWPFMGADSSSTTEVHLSFFDRWRVWRQYRKWKQWQLPVVMTTEAKMGGTQ